ncbi:SAVED domain-containing protein [Lujinxingia vulgaris]|uniref:SAVED domain-containing protein n=1 Tax=Lujinxingia vulgaris TaxID=2600176 RepID=A0A5C6X969_9DELT|nr:SAVED domain-containing protein [Lujinxingia vulgaris]TXD37908.1 SAVED domain-containing protein [Lujinxingia vulgaris]
MAIGQVGARVEGDVYQGLFFWKQAADLLRPNSLVERVVLEHDEAAGVDDVAVFFRDPGVNAGGVMIRADYYQLKYHVDNRNSYSSDVLIEPVSAKAKSSLLQRFYKAYSDLISHNANFRLHLASNWSWKNDDKLACRLREDGALPQKFFDDGPRGDFGKIREKWRAHLEIDDESFRSFAKTLRFQLNHFGRREFKSYVYATLEAAGLKVPSADRAACPYESLIQQFLMDGPNSFDRSTFRTLCKREGLLVDESSHKPTLYTIGVRSFVRFAERLESEVNEFVCVSHNFDGRLLASDGTWSAGASSISTFLADADRRVRLRGVPSVISLECHGSFALFSGWELSRNSGVDIAPIQKPSLEIWRSTTNVMHDDSWTVEIIECEDDYADVAVCLSVTHDISCAVKEFLLTAEGPDVNRIAFVSPHSGPSPQSIEGAGHAYWLASQIPAILTRIRPTRTTRVHLFFACPNALMFFIGQHRDALGPLALYEFDFGIERDGTYQFSFALPLA